jgi:hypothetical protein
MLFYMGVKCDLSYSENTDWVCVWKKRVEQKMGT